MLKKISWGTITIKALNDMKTSFKLGKKLHMERKRASYSSHFDVKEHRK